MMSNLKLLVGPASNILGSKISELMNIEKVNPTYKIFPDGESYVRIEDIEKEDLVILVQSLSPPQDRNLFVLLQMLSVLNDIGVKEVILVVPYLAYARQDKMFLPGEAISSKVVSKMLSSFYFKKLLVVEPHSNESISFFGEKAESISATNSVLYFIKEVLRKNYVVVAPDEGRLSKVIEISKLLGSDYGWLIKSRDRYSGKVESKIGKVIGKASEVLLFDDIVSTGGTISEAANILKKEGIKSIDLICVHGLFVGNAEERIREAGVRNIFCSDTVEGKFTSFSVSREIVEKLRQMIS
ncbi:MAG: ribose-phosphate diphosphokinase [Thermoproteota archaeon]